MSTESPWASERFGPRGARPALLVAGLIFMALIGGWAGLEVAVAWHAAHLRRAIGIALVALLLLLAALRIMTLNWRATRPDAELPDSALNGNAAPDADEPTGNWGVGGPSIREPGSTGSWRPRGIDRRDEGAE